MLPEPPTKPPELSSGEAKSLRLMRELDDHDVHGFFDLRVVGRICGSFPPWITVRWYQKAGIWWFVTFSHFPKSEVLCRIKTVGGTATSRPVAGEKKKPRKIYPIAEEWRQGSKIGSKMSEDFRLLRMLSNRTCKHQSCPACHGGYGRGPLHIVLLQA